MRIFWRTLVLTVFFLAFGILGYFAYINMSSVNHSGPTPVDSETVVTPQAPVAQETGPPAPDPLVFESSTVMTLPAKIAHHDWTKDLPVVVVVDKANTATLVLQMFDGNSVYAVYQADNAIGKEESPTPPGPYVVASKTLQPTWTPPKSIEKKQRTRKPFDQDKDNPLGVAAIRLNKWNIVLHGTNSPHSIGKEASHGCIRHRNDDIMRIYNSVWKGTPVIVADKLEGTKVSKDMFLPVKNKGS